MAGEFEGIASEECITFCNSRGLISSLRSCLEAAKRFFSNRKRLTAELDYFQDEGTEDDGHVVIRLVLESSPETAFREYRSWVEWFVANIEPYHRNLQQKRSDADYDLGLEVTKNDAEDALTLGKNVVTTFAANINPDLTSKLISSATTHARLKDWLQ